MAGLVRALGIAAMSVLAVVLLTMSRPVDAGVTSTAQPVIVTNPSTAPVPVAQIAGTSFAVQGDIKGSVEVVKQPPVTQASGAVFTVDFAPSRTPVASSAEQHVTLRFVYQYGPTPTYVMQRVHMDGTVEPYEYVVPDGHALIVTDASFEASGGAGSRFRFSLDNGNGNPVAQVVSATTYADLQLPAGVAVGAGRRLYARCETYSGLVPTASIVHGYLVTLP